MHVPLLLQLAVVLNSVHSAGAFVGMPSAGYIVGDARRSPDRLRVVCSMEGSLDAAVSSPEPLEQEQLYGFWAPATKEVPFVRDFHVRVRSSLHWGGHEQHEQHEIDACLLHERGGQGGLAA